jgi:hypothetical protein
VIRLMNQNRANFFGLILTLAAPFVLAGCNGGSLVVDGRYEGTHSISGTQEPVVAQVSSNGSSAFQIQLSLVLASVAPQTFSARVTDDAVFLQLPNSGGNEVSLQRVNSCASGSTSAGSVQLCWGSDKITLQMASESYEIRPASAKADQSSSGTSYTLDQLLGRTKYANYTITEEAERAYQARENIKVAIGKLLPHLSLSDVLGVAMNGPMGLIGTVGDLLPFIFPSNWYAWDQAKALSVAESKSFASLRGNEMSAVQGLYYEILRDQQILAKLDEYGTWLRQIQHVIQEKEQLGALKKGSAEYFGIRVAQVAQDEEQISLLLQQEKSALAYATALSPLNGITDLSPVQTPDLENTPPLSANDFANEAKTKSFELAAMDSMIQAAHEGTSQVSWGILDPTANTGGLNFGYASSLTISKSNENGLKIQREALSALIEQRSVDVAAQFNEALNSFKLADTTLRAGKDQMDRLSLQLESGSQMLDDTAFLDMLIETTLGLLSSDITRLSAAYSGLIAKSEFDRLLLQGFYQNLEAVLPPVPQ